MRALVAVLGAGSASRFAGEKLARPCAGKPLVSWALEAAIATGFDVAFIARPGSTCHIPEACTVVLNDEAEQGMATSIACAARIARGGDYDGLLVTLADMPLVTGHLLLRLVRAGATSACCYADGRLGAPAFFPSHRFTQLNGLAGDSGAGGIIAGWSGVIAVACDPIMLMDVDDAIGLELAVAHLVG